MKTDERYHGPITRDIVSLRTHMIAERAGRTPPHVTQADYEQAKREITGESDPELQQAALESTSNGGSMPLRPVTK